MCEKVVDPNEKKRGRPKKPYIKKQQPTPATADQTINTIINNMVNKKEELVLHIPISISEMQKHCDIKMKEEQTTHDEIFTISDITTTVSDSDSDTQENTNNINLINRIKELEEKIDEYEQKLCINKDNEATQRISLLNIRFVNVINGKQEVVEHTDVACWWCSHSFSSVPCFLPEKLINNTFYVFGNFCSYNCAAAYNIDINDFRVWERYGLLKKMYQMVYNRCCEINISPRKECLKMFGGPLTIEEFRSSLLINTKEYRLVMPPMKSIIPFIEENNDVTLIKKRLNANNTEYNLKRSKPLPGAKNNITNYI